MLQQTLQWEFYHKPQTLHPQNLLSQNIVTEM